jgi:hypothetical protein
MRNGGRAHAATNDYTQTWCTGGEIGHVVLSGGARVRYAQTQVIISPFAPPLRPL